MRFNFILPAGAWLSHLSLPPFTSSFWAIATTPSALLLRCTGHADMVKVASVLVLAVHSPGIYHLYSRSLTLDLQLIRNKDVCKSVKCKQPCVFRFFFFVFVFRCKNGHSSVCRLVSLQICHAHLLQQMDQSPTKLHICAIISHTFLHYIGQKKQKYNRILTRIIEDTDDISSGQMLKTVMFRFRSWTIFIKSQRTLCQLFNVWPQLCG